MVSPLNSTVYPADNVGMNCKKYAIPLIVLLVTVFPLSADRGDRTLVNEERSPFVFVVLPANYSVVPQSVSSITGALTRARDNLRIVAPEGMLPVSPEQGTLVGYYAGSASALSFRAVVIPLPTGRNPVKVNRSQIVRIGGTAVQLSQWDLPAYPEPVVPDGLDDEWSEESPILTFPAHSIPERVEDLSHGVAIEPEESVFWRMGGTMARRVYSIDGTGYWFVAVRSRGPILNNTGYHFRVVTDETPRQIIGEFSVLVDGRSGPVVYREPTRPIQWVGQYAFYDDFVEIQISKKSVRESLLGKGGRAESEVAHIEFSASHRSLNRAERFSLGSFTVTPTVLLP